MGILDSVVGDAVNAWNGGDGQVSKTGLQTFLNKFSSPAGRYVDTIDPLATFDVQFKFYPSLSLEEVKGGDKKDGFANKLGRVGNSLANSAKSAGMNALDSVTGGLASSLMDGGEDSVQKQHDEFENAHAHTFMEYLAKANLMQTGEQWEDGQQSPLVLNLGPYVQSITVPNLKIHVGKAGNSPMGEFPTTAQPGVHPDGQLQMEIINTRAALHERVFYPWLREVSLPYWSYVSQPYTTATVTVDFTKHNDAKYVFCGVRPEQVYTMQAKQSPDTVNLVRNVAFVYDAMFVLSDLKNVDGVGDKLGGAAGGLLGGAGKMLKL